MEDAYIWEQHLASLSDSKPQNGHGDEARPPLEPPLEKEEVLNIDGVQILFPYRAYESQKAIMRRMIACISSQKSEHAILESPPKTGKTAAILCGALGAFKHLEGSDTKTKRARLDTEGNFQLIYATRTECQMHTVVEQLQLTRYKYAPTAVIESQNRTCLIRLAKSESNDEEVSTLPRKVAHRPTIGMSGDHLPTGKNDWCQVPLNVQTAEDVDKLVSCCKHDDGKPLTQLPQGFGSDRGDKAFDNLKIVKADEEEKQVRSYNAPSDVQKDAKLVLCTYSYLLRYCIRRTSGLEINDRTVLVFDDDAHHIENVCRDIGSLHVKGGNIARLHREITSLQNLDPRFHGIRDIIAAVLGKLNAWFDEQASTAGNRQKEVSENKTQQIFNILEQINLSEQEIRSYYRALINAIEPGQGTSFAQLPFSNHLIQEFSEILWTFWTLYKASAVDKAGKRTCSENYTIYLVKQVFDDKLTGGSENNRRFSTSISLKVLCNNPAVIFSPMKAAHTIIVTSGNLSHQLDSFALELGVDFGYMKPIPPVIDSCRVFAAIIAARGKETQPLKFVYENVKDPNSDKFKTLAVDLAGIINDVSTKVPNGILVFFPSKALLSKFKCFWDKNGFSKLMSDRKELFYEHPPGKNVLDVLQSYRKSAIVGSGALFFGVFRGWLSEGMSFRDAEARAVITVGIPFSAKYDPAVMAKMNFNMVSRTKGISSLGANVWWKYEAFRTLNQAFSTCIGHVNDWSLIFMVETRLLEEDTMNFLPSWIHPSIVANEHIKNLQELVPRISQFVAAHQRQAQRN